MINKLKKAIVSLESINNSLSVEITDDEKKILAQAKSILIRVYNEENKQGCYIKYEESGIDKTIVEALFERRLCLEKGAVRYLLKTLFGSITDCLDDVKNETTIETVSFENCRFKFMASIKYINGEYITVYSFDKDIDSYLLASIRNRSRLLYYIGENSIKYNINLTHAEYFFDSIVDECLTAVKNFIDTNSIAMEEFLVMLNADE